MILDFILASLHHLAIFALFGLLLAELLFLRPGFDAGALKRVSRLDLAYGIAAGLVVIFGFSRVFFGAKDPNFYFDNPVFWAKIGLFAFIGFLSLVPTLRFIEWRRHIRRDPEYFPPAQEVWRMHRIVYAELGLFFLLPLLAAAMARGIGL